MLDARVKKEIIDDLHTPDQLRINLDDIDIVIAFLSVGGGKADMNLGKYMDTYKMERQRFNQKV